MEYLFNLDFLMYHDVRSNCVLGSRYDGGPGGCMYTKIRDTTHDETARTTSFFTLDPSCHFTTLLYVVPESPSINDQSAQYFNTETPSHQDQRGFGGVAVSEIIPLHKMTMPQRRLEGAVRRGADRFTFKASSIETGFSPMAEEPLYI